MDYIDHIRINFSSDDLTLMNFCLAFLMFGVALDMRIADFRRILYAPRPVAIGLISQLILLPLLTVVLIAIWGPMPSMALGLILIASCPGGNISNFAVHLSRGNAALSVTLTAIVTVGAMLITPLNFTLWANLFPETQLLLRDISISPVKLFEIIFLLILLPLIAGMIFAARLPKLTSKVKRLVRYLSILIFFTFIVFALISNYGLIIKYIYLVFLLVVVHNLIALLGGYWFSKLNGLSYRDCKAISIETGIQNAGLGLILIFNFFNHLGGMMLVAAFWGVWDLVSSFALSMYWSRRAQLETTEMAH